MKGEINPLLLVAIVAIVAIAGLAMLTMNNASTTGAVVLNRNDAACAQELRQCISGSADPRAAVNGCVECFERCRMGLSCVRPTIRPPIG